MLSLAWGDSALVSGGADGIIRIWDPVRRHCLLLLTLCRCRQATGRVQKRITVEHFGGEKTLVWAVKLLKYSCLLLL